MPLLLSQRRVPRPPPLAPSFPRQAPIWALAIGAWGDTFAACGNVREMMSRLGLNQVGLLHYGYDPAVADFLAAQPWAGQVWQVWPQSGSAYTHTVARACRGDDSAEWLPAILHGSEFVADAVWPAHVPLGCQGVSPHHWRGARLPTSAVDYARCLQIRERFVLVHPYSLQSARREQHWPHWIQAIEWLLESGETVVLTGQLKEPTLAPHSRLHDLRGDTESYLQVLALAERCRRVVTTSNALAMWAVMQHIPTLTCAASNLCSYYRRWIDAAPNVVLPHDATLHTFQSAFASDRHPSSTGATGTRIDRAPVAVEKVWTSADFGGTQNVIRLVVPAGIGDFAWIYAKIRHLKQLTGREVIVRVAGEEPRRGGALVALLPDVHWGGYASQDSWRTLIQSLPAEWPASMGIGPFCHNGEWNLAPNIHLELGRRLEEWLPMLPTDFHFRVAIPELQRREAEQILAGLPRPVIAVYVSNREKEQHVAAGWALWTAQQWLWVLGEMRKHTGFERCSFVFVGADYDADKTGDVACGATQRGWPVAEVVGRPLGVALESLRLADYCLSYPSGIGIMAHVLDVPGLMLLATIHTGLQTSWIEPSALASGRFRAWSNPTPEAAAAWLRAVGLKHVNRS